MSDNRLHHPKTLKPPLTVGAAVGAQFPVIAIGASAGGLDACRALLRALPAGHGMALIFIQHLEPNHASMLPELLAADTTMVVHEATKAMLLEPDHLYLIPPGSYLSVDQTALHFSPPGPRDGARLPFDFLLHAMAQAFGPRAACVVLSGHGADGSAGLVAIKQARGLVLAQLPDEAGFDGMPRSAIATGKVDFVLSVAEIAQAIVQFGRRLAAGGLKREAPTPGGLHAIIDLLRTAAGHDFTLYKEGTLRRRIERRMSLLAMPTSDKARYLEVLRSDRRELDQLAKDLLINVTSFFRDPPVFRLLAATIVPNLVHRHAQEQPLRVWVAGCSTGEETYSLAILFREFMLAAQTPLKLQIFASDVDQDAVAAARDGLYPAAIAADVSPERLARFFIKEEKHYRVVPELRAMVVFTVQDVLADPPFSRIDLVSCRNLLIYLGPEAQRKALALFHFALTEGGYLLLGSAETTGESAGRFEVVAKPQRLYRRIGRSRASELRLALGTADATRLRLASSPAPTGQAALAELCRRLVIDTYAPAVVLITRQYECVYAMGPTDRYLRVPPGPPTLDLLAMARPELRSKLRVAIDQATQAGAGIVSAASPLQPGGPVVSVHVQPVLHEGKDLLLVSFVDGPAGASTSSHPAKPGDLPRVAALEHELATARAELQGAIHNLESANEEQRATNEEALSVNEEYQSTNEELLTSKEELQSLNEELTALNSQLQETLQRQRTTSNDLQNVLFSTDVATLFLDPALNIRFYTPATRSLFRVIPGDIGRPLADLTSLAADAALPADARDVLQHGDPIEREIQAQGGGWFTRRILPYRTHDNGVEGVVITFTDVTERKAAAKALELAKHEAEQASLAKSRFLAAASHDLRQPLQTLALLQGLLARTVVGEPAQKLVVRVDQTLGAMSGMLNTLLDINQIEAGTVRVEMSQFCIGALLDRLRDEFTYHAQAKGLGLRVMPCSVWIHTDPRLLEQMVRNLLSNALKYTKRGRVLVGCRRHAATLDIQIWDTGIGIPDGELSAIFEEYHQLDNAARERSRGLGLGLAIVQRLGHLLDHPVSVHSRPGKGSVFAIAAPLAAPGAPPVASGNGAAVVPGARGPQPGSILVIEDDPELRELLEHLLTAEGHGAVSAADGPAALDLVARGVIRPDLVLSDYNLPNGMNGLQAAAALRKRLHQDVPVVILTGDIATATLSEIARHNCAHLNKPIKLQALTTMIGERLAAARATRGAAALIGPGAAAPVIFIVDDDRHLRDGLRQVFEDDGRSVEDYADCETFLAAYRPGQAACLLIDADLPGMSGLQLLHELAETGPLLPAIMITGHSDVSMAVQAMKAGASDFIEKPLDQAELLATVAQALARSNDSGKLAAWRGAAAAQLAGLTPRQHEVLERVLAGHPSKNIAADLGISRRTVENHRASIMERTGATSLPALARLAVAAGGSATG